MFARPTVPGVPVAIVAIAVVAGLTACSSAGGATASPGAGSPAAASPVAASPAASTPAPAVTVTVTATAAPAESPAMPPAGYFTDGTTYDAWVLAVHPDGTIVIRLGQHLTGDDAVSYLESHGQAIGPEGLPDDYTNVDLGKEFTVALSGTAASITTNDGSGPKTMTVAQFRSWLPKHLSMTIPVDERDAYTGAPHYFGTLLALTFSANAIATADQIFMP